MNDVGACFGKPRVDVADDLNRAGQQAIVADELVIMIGAQRNTILGLAELVAPDHGTHGPILQQCVRGRRCLERRPSRRTRYREPGFACAHRGNSVDDLISSMDSREVMLKIFTWEMRAW